MTRDGAPPWMCRALGFGLALVAAKAIMVGMSGGIAAWSLWTLPALLHDHLLITLLYGGMELVARIRGRRSGEEEAANRAMWLLFGLGLLWAAMAVPITATLGAPAGLAEMRASGGVWAVMTAGLGLGSTMGAIIVLAAGFSSALLLRRAPRRRVTGLAVVVMGLVGVLGGLGRGRVDLGGLERDPFAIVIQTSAQGLRDVLGG